MRYVVAAVACLLAAGPARAGTLRVESAILVSPVPGQAGHLHVEGRVFGFGIDTRTMLRVEVGGNARWVQLRPTATDVLSIRNAEQGYSVTFNTRLQRILADEPDVMPQNPLPIALRQGAQVACTMIQFKENAEGWTFSAGQDAQFPCTLRQAPVADRTTIGVGKDEKVSFRLALASGKPDKGVRLVRVDEHLARVGKPVCELRDSGRKEDADERAEDGIYGCVATLHEPAAGPIRLRAEAEFGGEKVSSPSVTIDAAEAGTAVAPTGQ